MMRQHHWGWQWVLRDRGRGWGWTLRYDMDSMRTCLGLAQAVDATGAWVVGVGGC